MSRKLPETWPDRPKGFYEDWSIFCRQVLSSRIQQKESEDLAVVLLAGGAILGGAGLVWLIRENRETIDTKGKKWGIDDLSTYAGIGGAVLGAAIGGVGANLLMRTLGRYADTTKVDALQAKLAQGQRAFIEHRQDLQERRLNVRQHRLVVERLFLDLTQ